MLDGVKVGVSWLFLVGNLCLYQEPENYIPNQTCISFINV